MYGRLLSNRQEWFGLIFGSNLFLAARSVFGWFLAKTIFSCLKWFGLIFGQNYFVCYLLATGRWYLAYKYPGHLKRTGIFKSSPQFNFRRFLFPEQTVGLQWTIYSRSFILVRSSRLQYLHLFSIVFCPDDCALHRITPDICQFLFSF